MTFINYFLRRKERKRLTKYLQTGGFKKIAGSKEHGKKIKIRRLYVICLGIILISIGIYYVVN